MGLLDTIFKHDSSKVEADARSSEQELETQGQDVAGQQGWGGDSQPQGGEFGDQPQAEYGDQPQGEYGDQPQGEYGDQPQVEPSAEGQPDIGS